MLRTVTLALLALLLTASTASAQEPTPLPAAPGSEAEPNDTPDTATPIEAGERIRAPLPANDVDLYRFTAEAGDRVYAAVITARSAQSDSTLAVLGSDGQTVLEADNDNGTLQANSSSIAGTAVPASGVYYLRVGAPGSQTVLPYDLVLEVQSGDPVPEVEPNSATHQPLEGDRFVSGTTATNDQDLWGLELAAGDTVFLSLDLDPERDGETFNGRVMFGNETVLVANDIGNSDAIPSEAFVGTVSVDGRYNVLVDAAVGSGTYQLSATVIRAVERGCRSYSPTPGATTTFPIEVPDAGTVDHVAVRLDLTHTFMNDLDATLAAPAGNQTALFDDIGASEVGGPNTRMLTLFDDNAGFPPVYPWLKGFALQPERGLDYFAGQPAAGTWQLTLRDDANQDVGELARADLILCMRPDEGPAHTVFSADFESGDDAFTHSGTADEWEQGTPATPEGPHLAALTSCARGAGCFKTDLDGTYEANSSQDLVSPPISLDGRTGEIYASWQHWFQLEGVRFEHFTVSVEEDGGANPRTLFRWGGNDMAANLGNPQVQLALAAGWGRHRADVSDYAGKTIRLRFHLDSDGTVQRRGVAIDDVRVYQPLAVAAADGYDTDEETQLTVDAPGVLGNDGDASAAALESGPQHGQLELDPDGSFTYTPERDFNGTDSFTYRAHGAGATSEPATVTIHVHAVDDATAAADDAYATDEDTPLNVDAPGLLANDSDPDDALTAALVTGPAHGNVEVRPDGSLTYTPERDFNGTDSFVYRAGGATATVTIEVRPVDDPAPPASPPGDVLPAAASDEAAISDLTLGSRCVRRSATGRVRVPMTMTLTQPGAIRVSVERAVGSRGRSSCPRANPKRNQRFRGVAEFRPVATAQAASTTRRVKLNLRLRPGLYRITVRLQLEDGRQSAPVRRFLRVLG
jgi:subtilisin-like proprotein convertase family protein